MILTTGGPQLALPDGSQDLPIARQNNRMDSLLLAKTISVVRKKNVLPVFKDNWSCELRGYRANALMQLCENLGYGMHDCLNSDL